MIDALDSLLAIRDGQPTARWNFVDAVGSPTDAPGGIGNAVALSYSFLNAAADDHPTTGFEAFSASQENATRAVLAQWSMVARIGFTEVDGLGDLRFGADEQSGSSGYAFSPSFGYSSSNGIIVSTTASAVAGDVWLASNVDWVASDFDLGGTGYGVLVHEIGHAIGLKHGFEATGGGMTLDPALESLAWTAMSYTPHPHGVFRTVFVDAAAGSYTLRYESVLPESPMMLDILVAQYLYGANTESGSGDDIYTFDPLRPFLRTIYDAGGTDTLSVANFSSDCTIDLRDGHFSSIAIPSDQLPDGVVETRADVYDGTDNLAIAFGVLIENATGGGGSDTLIGNAVANALNGGGGNDTLNGGAGNDTLVGGTGLDTMTGGTGDDTFHVDNAGDLTSEADGGGVDWVISAVNRALNTYTENLRLSGAANSGTGSGLANRMEANAGLSTNLFGGGGDDTLIGGAGGDTLNGATGNDSMVGGGGSDIYIVDALDDIVVELPGQGTDRVSASVSWTLGDNFERLNFSGSVNADGTGNELANFLQGNGGINALLGLDGNDTITAGAGNDTLDGGSGNDVMLGEGGNDIYHVDASGDITQESSALVTEIDLVYSSVNRTLNTNIEQLTLTGTAISGAGNNSHNLITGNAEHNSLLGVAGNDTLAGNDGNDTLNGGTGNDSLLGGAGNDVYAVDSSGDVVVELSGEGTDRVASTVNGVLGEHVENLTLAGSAGISGTGNALDNVIGGNPGANAIDGGAGNDTLSGFDGNDTLTGGAGGDRLGGGLGADSFRFVTTGEGSDTITDFASGTDKIAVVAANFGLVAGAAANLFVNSAPSSGAAAFIYTSATGALSFDADGNGAGAAVTLATLSSRPASLALGDIVLGG